MIILFIQLFWLSKDVSLETIEDLYVFMSSSIFLIMDVINSNVVLNLIF